MNFCEEVFIVAAFNQYTKEIFIKVYPPHRKKDAEAEKQFWISKKSEAEIYRVKNKGFKLTFTGFRGKYFGSSVLLLVRHPELNKDLKTKDLVFVLETDTMGFSNMLREDSLVDNQFTKTYSIDLFRSSLYQGSYRLVRDSSDEIKEGIRNYNQYWYSDKHGVLTPGSIYRDRYGDIYLSLTDKVWSRKYSHQFCGLEGGYSMLNWGTTLPNKVGTTVLLYLGNNLSILPRIKNIAKSEESLESFFKTIVCSNLKSFFPPDSAPRMFQSDFLRLKKYSSGKFIKLDEINNYKLLYKKIGGWTGLRSMIMSFSYNLAGLCNQDTPKLSSIDTICSFFSVSSDQFSSDLTTIEREILKEYRLNQITGWWTNPSDRKTFGTRSGKLMDFYDSSILELTEEQLNDFSARRLAYSTDSWTCSELVDMGVFGSVEELLKHVNDIRK